MTFTEAAAQVLRLVGKPLHYKEITDVAIERDLLSHVGKSPEVTMGARLAALVKKGDKENPLVRIKPGVFALRDWDQETIERGLADRTPALKMLEDQEPDEESLVAENGGDAGAEAESEDTPAAKPKASAVVLDEDEEAAVFDPAERQRAELAANASELFAPEADDDEPILGGAEDEEDEDLEGEEPRGGDDLRRRRRRRRRGRGGGSDDLPTYTVSDATGFEPGGEEGPRGQPQELREGREQREGREPRESREQREGGREQRDRGEWREREPRESREPRDSGPALDDLDGIALSDAAVELLGSFERQGPVPLRQLVDAARRRGRLTGDPSQAVVALSAALRADIARRTAEGQRPRVRFAGNRVGLTDWLLDGELRRLEREAISAVDRYRDAARRSLLRRIQGLPHRAIGELAMILLERLGVTELAPARRPGSSGAELNLTGRAPGPISPVVTGILIRRDGRDVGREQVTELRGSLHHFGAATAGLIVTTGQVLSGAREEAASPGASPVRLIDGASFARLCEQHGIAVTETRLSMPLPDAELFEALRNNNG